MATVKDIYNYIDSFAPFEKSMEFDNTGILIGDENCEVKTVLVALDITGKVIDEALALNAQLIVTHHPVIFGGMKSVTADTMQYKLIKSGISVISAHTNLDLASPFGVNTVFAEALELDDYYFQNDKDPIVIGKLKNEMTSDSFADFVKAKLNCTHTRTNAKTMSKKVKTVAVGGGTCGEYVGLVASLGIDAFVTGEMKHHEFLYADEHNLLAFDVGHFYSENIVVKPLAKKLSDYFTDVEFVASKLDGSY